MKFDLTVFNLTGGVGDTLVLSSFDVVQANPIDFGDRFVNTKVGIVWLDYKDENKQPFKDFDFRLQIEQEFLEDVLQIPLIAPIRSAYVDTEMKDFRYNHRRTGDAKRLFDSIRDVFSSLNTFSETDFVYLLLYDNVKGIVSYQVLTKDDFKGLVNSYVDTKYKLLKEREHKKNLMLAYEVLGKLTLDEQKELIAKMYLDK